MTNQPNRTDEWLRARAQASAAHRASPAQRPVRLRRWSVAELIAQAMTRPAATAVHVAQPQA